MLNLLGDFKYKIVAELMVKLFTFFILFFNTFNSYAWLNNLAQILSISTLLYTAIYILCSIFGITKNNYKKFMGNNLIPNYCFYSIIISLMIFSVLLVANNFIITAFMISLYYSIVYGEVRLACEKMEIENGYKENY